MQLWQAALLGVVEGVTEFLPVSSTAHLLLASRLLGIPQTEVHASFEIVIQLGAILAAAVLYGRTLLRSRAVLLRVAAAFVPTAVIGALAHRLVKTVLLPSPTLVLWTLLLGGVALILFELWHREPADATDDLARMTYAQAVAIGCCQSLAIVPGVSRAAATVVGGLLLGLRRTAIVDFSFLLAIPTMAAASALDVVKTASEFSRQDVMALGVGFVVSFIVALMVIRWLLAFIRRHTFVAFGVERIVVALLFFWLLAR